MGALATAHAPPALEGREPSRPADAGRATTRAYEGVRERGARPRTPGCDGLSPFDDGVTLEDVVLHAWEDLVAEGRCACPACGGSMASDPHAVVVSRVWGTCVACGSELS